MADTIEKILSVRLDDNDALQGIIKLNEQIDENKAKMTELAYTTGKNTKEYQTLEQQTKALTNEKRALSKELQNEIKMQSQETDSLKAMRAELSKLTNQYDSLSKAERENASVGGALLKNINELTTQIKSAEEASQRYYRNVGNYPEVAESVKGSLRAVQDEIVNLTLRYREMSDEMKNSEAGQALKAQIDQLTAQASKYRDIVADVKASVSRGASDTFALDAFVQGAQTLTATMGLAKNASVALGISNESLQKSMLKIQQAMQAVQALQVIQNALQKESNLMKGIAIVQSKALAAAERIEAAVKAQGTAATVAQTAAMRAFNAVAKANPYVLLATGLATVIGGIFGFTSATREQTEAEAAQAEQERKNIEMLEREAEAQKVATDAVYARNKAEEKAADTIATSVSKQLTNYTYLQEKWRECGNDLKRQEEFLRKYRKELDATGFAVRSVHDAHNLLIAQADDVIAMYYALAEAEAGAKVQEEALANKLRRKAKGGVEEGAKYYKLSTHETYLGAYGERGAVTQEEYAALIAQGQGMFLSKNDYSWARTAAEGKVKRDSKGKLRMPGVWLSTEGYALLDTMRQNAANARKAAFDAEDDALFQLGQEMRMRGEATAERLQKNIKVSYGTGGSKSRGGGATKKTTTKSGETEEQKKARLAEEEFQKRINALIAEGEKLRIKTLEEESKTDIAKVNELTQKRKEAVIKKYGERKVLEDRLSKAETDADKKRWQEALNAYDEMMSNIDTQRAQAIGNIFVQKWQKQIEQYRQSEEDAMRLSQYWLDATKEGTEEHLRWRLDILARERDAELELYGNSEEMKAAIIAKYAEQERVARQENADAVRAIEQEKYKAIGSMVGGLGQTIGAFGEQSKELAAIQKTLALGEVMIAQAVAIANAIKKATTDPSNFTVWQMIAAIASSVTAVTVAMGQAFTSLKQAKFATGGYIRGAGTSTSDSIPVRVSNGESIMNANTTAMFSGLLSSLNQLGGGVPIQVEQTASSVRGEDMLARAFARGVAMLPNPVVSVEDINKGQRQVEVMNQRATL